MHSAPPKGPEGAAPDGVIYDCVAVASTRQRDIGIELLCFSPRCPQTVHGDDLRHHSSREVQRSRGPPCAASVLGSSYCRVAATPRRAYPNFVIVEPMLPSVVVKRRWDHDCESHRHGLYRPVYRLFLGFLQYGRSDSPHWHEWRSLQVAKASPAQVSAATRLLPDRPSCP